MASERRLLVTTRRRGPARLDDALPELPDPTLDELRTAAPDEPVWLCGGEPTLRADLPAIVGAIRTAGLVTDGLALADPSALAPLVERGLRRLRVVLHAARPDAHDWLVGQRGAARRAVRALRVARQLGVECEIEATVTRPTAPQLAELALLAGELGARSLHLRRLEERGPAANDLIALAPRLGLIARDLEAASRAASLRGIRLSLHGFPRCVAPPERRALPPSWHLPLPEARAALAPLPHVRGCARCPGPPSCDGIPAAYHARFGLDLEVSQPTIEVVRLRFGAPSRVVCSTCGEDEAEPEPTRRLRLRLVRAAQTGARVLRIASAGSLAHPAAAELLRECTLLGFERVEIAGEASALDEMDDASLYALRGLTRLDAALFGPTPTRHDAHVRPGAFEATMRGLRRLRDLAAVEIGSYAVLHDANQAEAFAKAWSAGELPGAPVFRLSPQGDDLRALALVAERLDAPARTALAAVLPTCLLARDASASPGAPEVAFHDGIDQETAPSASDRRGNFLPCPCGAPCPGLAVGWRS